MANIAVLGGGGTGLTMAADLTLRGHSVCLWEAPQYFENLRWLLEHDSKIELIGRAANGTATITKITDDLSSAVSDATVILIAMIANRHEALCELLGPLLKDGQTVCFSTGNCGSICLRQHLNGQVNVVIGEMLGNIYPCRLEAPGQVSCAFPYAPKKAAAFPGRDTPALMKALAGVYDCLPAANVFETALNSPGLSIHLAGSLLNTGAIEQMNDFRLYRDGLSPSVLACMKKVEQERELVLTTLGLATVRHCGMIEHLMENPKTHPELADFRVVSGPNALKHRYVSEDSFAGHALLLSLAQQFGLSVPCMDALVTLASLLNEEDYRTAGITTTRLGISGLSPAEINRYLETGIK